MSKQIKLSTANVVHRIAVALITHHRPFSIDEKIESSQNRTQGRKIISVNILFITFLSKIKQIKSIQFVKGNFQINLNGIFVSFMLKSNC